MKIKQKQYTARIRAYMKMADTPIRNKQPAEEIESSGYEKKSPRRLRAKYTHRTSESLYSVSFVLPEGLAGAFFALLKYFVKTNSGGDF